MRMLTSKILILTLIAILVLSIIGCSDPGMPEQPKQKRNVLNVYVSEDYGPGKEGAILVAKIRMIDGKINLTPVNMLSENDKLMKAIEEIQARPSLELMYEDMEDGKLMMYVINITPENENYIYALRHALLFDYNIKSVEATETIQ